MHNNISTFPPQGRPSSEATVAELADLDEVVLAELLEQVAHAFTKRLKRRNAAKWRGHDKSA